MPNTFSIQVGDVQDVLPTIESASFDAVLCDPPYGLSKAPDAAEVLRHWLAGDKYEHTGAGFMGKDWDSFVPGPEIWKEVYRILKPGGHLLAFAGTRTQDLMGMAIRLAGFELRDTICYMYGSGFPKSLNIYKAINKAAEDSPEPAKVWEGYGTALKPAYESVLVAQKPLDLQGVCGILAHKIMEAVCQLALSAMGVEENSKSSYPESTVGSNSALWLAVSKCSTPGDLLDLTDTLPLELGIPSSLNIALSWLNTLGGVLRGRSTFTTETVSSLITDLKTLSFSPSPITPDSIIQAATNRHGTGSSAPLAELTFNAVEARLRLTHGLSVPECATLLGEGLALHPGLQPVIVAMKPLDGTFANNALTHGVAGINIDGCRVGTSGPPSNRFTDGAKPFGNGAGHPYETTPPTSGRWPANVILSHTEECRLVGTKKVPSGVAVNRNKTGPKPGTVYGKYAEEGGRADITYAGPDGKEEVENWECSEDCPVRLLDEQSGQRKAGGYVKTKKQGFAGNSYMSGGTGVGEFASFADSGGASRFFYCAKSSRGEREEGLESFGKVPGSPCVCPEPDFEQSPFERPEVKNTHPTVKPLKLTEYLAKLLLPPERGAPRRLLVPFSGSGSEMIGGLLAGWDEVTGVEIDRKYAKLAAARVLHWVPGVELKTGG